MSASKTAGIRAIGYVSPATIRLPWDVQSMLPEGVLLLSVTLSVRQYTPAEFDKARAEVTAAVERLAAESAGAIIAGGVPVAIRNGFASEDRYLAELSKSTGAAVTSGIRAAVDRLNEACRRLLIVSPYPEGTNDLLCHYLREAGLEIEGVTTLDAHSPAESALLTSDQYRAAARELLGAHPRADGILLAGRGNMMATGHLMAAETGLPVVTPNEASFIWALSQLPA